MSPAEVFRTRARMAELAEGLTRRAQGLLVSKWLPRPSDVRTARGGAGQAPSRPRADV
jgi:hypothetical protein